MITIEEMELMLNELAEELPKEFYSDLNGGISLQDKVKIHEKSYNDDLYVMGEYHRSPTMGRYIAIYYGSFVNVYGHLQKEEIKQKLRETLRHEFRHHLESLSGEKDLEIEDAKDLYKYLNKE